MINLTRASAKTNALVFGFPQRLFVISKLSLLLNIKFLLISGIAFIILFLSIYIFQIATLISQGYQIQSYRNKINDITEENKILEINSVKINSLGNVESKIRELGFEKVDRIDYIQILESSAVTASKKME